MHRAVRWFVIPFSVVLVVAFLLGAIAISASGHRATPPKVQVKRVAPTTGTPSPLLPVTEGHVSDIPRPAETYAFPIPLGEVGPVEPLFAGQLQYPFICQTESAGLGQPLVDNHQGYGVPVYRLDDNGAKTDEVIGFSQDCLMPSRLRYFFRSARDGLFYDYHPSKPVPEAEIEQLDFDGERVPFIVRVEQGTINRYIYTIAMLVGRVDKPERLSKTYWNGRLIYRFIGGVGIGFRQGRFWAPKELRKRFSQLAKGYALISSTVNKTSHTYNILLQEDTARRVKQQFVSLYGEPLYTVGIGGSGGGIQQYLLAQNAPGLIDAAIPLYSYPDMVTQTIYGLDCDLLENYFLFRAEDKRRWEDYEARRDLMGLNARNGEPHWLIKYVQPINQLIEGQLPRIPGGNSECLNGWLGLSTLVHNPKQGYLVDHYADEVVKQVRWTYWEDLNQVYGRDEHGYARPTWDNVGVQYGLRALREGRLDAETFLSVNRQIGSWKPQHQMEPEKLLTLVNPRWPLWLSYPSRHNMTESDNQGAAVRRSASLEAIEAAYRSGQVFIGKATIPILDLRHYLEHRLDMHHLSASFNSRLRLQAYQGHAANQVIWVSHEDYVPLNEAFEAMDRWMLALKASEDGDPVASRPASISDTCFDRHGSVVASGDDVWDGNWNNRPPGTCTQTFPIYSTSRIEAGAPWTGDVFKCRLIPVEQAIERGVYGEQDMRPYIGHLKLIFPSGVCDWEQGDQGRPQEI